MYHNKITGLVKWLIKQGLHASGLGISELIKIGEESYKELDDLYREESDKGPLEIMASVVDEPGFYFTMSSVERVSFNPRSSYDTPLGLYSYQLTSKHLKDLLSAELPFRAHAKYVHVFYSSPAHTLFLSKYSEEDLEKDIRMLREMTVNDQVISNEEFDQVIEEGTVNARISTTGGKIWNITRLLAQEYIGKHMVIWSRLMFKLGYYTVIDDGCMGIIHENEPCQAVSFVQYHQPSGTISHLIKQNILSLYNPNFSVSRESPAPIAPVEGTKNYSEKLKHYNKKMEIHLQDARIESEIRKQRDRDKELAINYIETILNSSEKANKKPSIDAILLALNSTDVINELNSNQVNLLLRENKVISEYILSLIITVNPKLIADSPLISRYKDKISAVYKSISDKLGPDQATEFYLKAISTGRVNQSDEINEEIKEWALDTLNSGSTEHVFLIKSSIINDSKFEMDVFNRLDKYISRQIGIGYSLHLIVENDIQMLIREFDFANTIPEQCNKLIVKILKTFIDRLNNDGRTSLYNILSGQDFLKEQIEILKTKGFKFDQFEEYLDTKTLAAKTIESNIFKISDLFFVLDNDIYSAKQKSDLKEFIDNLDFNLFNNAVVGHLFSTATDEEFIEKLFNYTLNKFGEDVLTGHFQTIVENLNTKQELKAKALEIAIRSNNPRNVYTIGAGKRHLAARSTNIEILKMLKDDPAQSPDILKLLNGNYVFRREFPDPTKIHNFSIGDRVRVKFKSMFSAHNGEIGTVRHYNNNYIEIYLDKDGIMFEQPSYRFSFSDLEKVDDNTPITNKVPTAIEQSQVEEVNET